MFDETILKTGLVVDGRFTLARKIGKGAFGVVWLATDGVLLGREVALKVLHPRFGGEGNAGERLAREAAVLARMDHPNIARAVGFSAREGLTYLATEYVDGMPLHEFMATQGGEQIPMADVARIFDELCSAVAYAHGQAVIHRDLKPQNVMIQRRGASLFVKVLDFGVAKIMEGNASDGTTQGRTIGSLFYLSPEQTRGDPTTTSSDIFALGSMLFEILTLHRMWAHDRSGAALPAFTVPLMADVVNSITNVVERIVVGPRPRATEYRRGLPAGIDRVIAKAAAVKPQDRYPTVEALRQDALELLGAPAGIVQPVDVGDDSEEEMATQAGRGDLVEPSAFEAQDVHVHTLQVEGGVSAYIEAEEPAPPQPPPMPDDEPALPTVHKTRVGMEPDPMKTRVQVEDRTAVSFGTAGLAEPPNEPTMLPTSPDLRAVAAFLEPSSSQRLKEPSTRKIQYVLIAAALVLTGAIGALFMLTGAPDDEVGQAVVIDKRPAVGAVPGAKAAPSESPHASSGAPHPTASASAEPSRAGRADGSAVPKPSPTIAPTVAPTVAPKKSAAPRSELASLLERARAAPADVTRLSALASAIDSAAEKVSDARARVGIRRLASNSAMVGSLDGLEQAYRDLASGLERSGQVMP